MENNSGTQIVFDEDEDTLGTQIVFNEDEDDDDQYMEMNPSQIPKETKQEEKPSKKEEKQEEKEGKRQEMAETPPQTRNRWEYENQKKLKGIVDLFDVIDPISQEVVFFKKIPRTLEKENRIAKEIEEMLLNVNPYLFTKNFDKTQFAKIVREFYDMPKVEYVKDGNGKDNEEDDDLMEKSNHAIQYQEGVHVIMEFASQLKNESRLLVFLQEKLPTLIRLFIVATFKRKHSPEDFYKDFIAMTTIFAYLFPKAKSSDIFCKIFGYIKSESPNLVQNFLRRFNEEKYSVYFKFKSIYEICRDIYFVCAPLQDRLNLASFLIGAIKESFIFSKSQDYISVEDLQYMKKLFLLSKSVLCDLLPDENVSPSNKKKRDGSDENNNSVKKPKIVKKYQLQTSVDPSKKWILMIDKAVGKETLIEEDDDQKQIDVYCAHVHKRGVLKKYLQSFDKKINQKLCPVCDTLSRNNKNIFYFYFFSSLTFFLVSSGANGLNPF